MKQRRFFFHYVLFPNALLFIYLFTRLHYTCTHFYAKQHSKNAGLF